MNETMVTLVGNVATAVEYRDSASGGFARFRFAVTSRRWDRQRDFWVDGATSFYNVWAWRGLGQNLAASVAVGEPLVVQGRLRVRDEEKEGQRRTFVDIDAVAVGHDLSRGTSAFRRVARGDTVGVVGKGPDGRDGPDGQEAWGREQDGGAAVGDRPAAAAAAERTFSAPF
ncbi:single-stranded DNA-binding protein [Streptomyces sp. NPDC127084]|uniref:single-stranded DNA-binding protein n=1 Tax=Streptomyces sp. NPDC127084 TaxID=3347133 RepID=UPI003654781A